MYLGDGIQTNFHLQRRLLLPRISLNAQNHRNVMTQGQKLAIYIPHRDVKVELPIFDLFGCHTHSQPLHPVLWQRRLDLEIHNHRREPHAGTLLVLGFEVFSFGVITGSFALAGRLQQLAQLRRS